MNNMNDPTAVTSAFNRAAPMPRNTREIVLRSLAKRRAAERRFRWYGLSSILLGLTFLVLLFADVGYKGYSAFHHTVISLDIYFDPEVLTPSGERDPETLAKADYNQLIKTALKQLFPEVTDRRQRRELYALVSSGAQYQLLDYILADPSQVGRRQRFWLIADDDVDMLEKGHVDRNLPEAERRIKDRQLVWLDQLREQDRLQRQFNWTFFNAGDSREPEQAGIRGALMGSFFTLLGTFLLSFPLGVATALYLEEFAPSNRWTDIIEVNINNLGAVPSIVFGLLGLAVFINFFGLPRSTPLVGCLVLTLMTLPTIIIASRAALKSVPPSIREAALGVGASKLQMVFHHVLPLAIPGMLTGSIIGMARALGETAPLLMIGMVAFILDIPRHVMEPATVLPVQIYLWADSSERAFVEKTSAAIIVLLLFLITMNACAVLLRKRYERRW